MNNVVSINSHKWPGRISVYAVFHPRPHDTEIEFIGGTGLYLRVYVTHAEALQLEDDFAARPGSEAATIVAFLEAVARSKPFETASDGEGERL